MRVLVVDDDELNRRIVESVLMRRGHEVVTVSSGEAALRAAHEAPPDNVVSDVFMPGMDGFRLCMLWRKDPALADIPLVFHTSMFTSAADRAFALRLGARALLTKPMDPEKLLDAIEAAASAVGESAPGLLPDDEFAALSEYTDRIVERLEDKVAELNEANTSLVQSTEMQSALVDCSPLGIAMMDGDCSLRLWSPAAERIFAWTSADVIGVFNPIVHGDRATAAILKGLLETGETITDMELVRRRGDAATFVMSLSAARVMDADGEASGILAMFSDVTERKQSEQDLEAAVSRLERAMNGSIRVISRMIEKRDPYTAGHEERVAGLAVAIGQRMGLDEQNLRELHTAGAVHDVGKISIPTEILAKPGTLTPPEWEMIKVHPAVGLEILEAVDLGWPLAEVVSQHHERMDGSGYPAGLVGENILLEARILAVADVVEAMSSHRPYRPARGVDEAMAEIRLNRGRLYDGAVVDACLAVVERGEFLL
jgi:PAS domain S-box-containing protein